MSWLSNTPGGLVLEAVTGIGSKLIDRLFPDKVAQAKERAEAELVLQESMNAYDIKKMEAGLSAIIAEAKSEDPWTSRARPSFMYVIYLMILFSIPMGFLTAFKPDMAVAVTTGVQAWLAAIPESLWALFGAGYLGYTGFRSLDKRTEAGSGR